MPDIVLGLRSKSSVKTWSAVSAPIGERRDEMLGCRRHHDAHRSAALAQPADEIQRL